MSNHQTQHQEKHHIRTKKIKAQKFSKKEREAFREVFNNFDLDKNGTLDEKEMTAFMEQCNIDRELAKVAMRLIDDDKNGQISFNEFCNFLKILKKVEKDPNILYKMMFEALDLDKSGYLELNEIYEFVNCFSSTPISKNAVADFLSDYDNNHDNRLSYQEVLRFIS